MQEDYSLSIEVWEWIKEVIIYMILVYYKVENSYNSWHYDNYLIVTDNSKPSLEELNKCRTNITKQWGVAPIIINIMELG